MEFQRTPPPQRTGRHISYKNSSCKQTVHHPITVRKPAQLPGLPCGDKNLYVTGISITKLGKPAIADGGRNRRLTVQYAHSSHVTSAQTSGWKLKYIPVQNIPVIHTYSRPLKVNLNGHTLNSSNPQAKEFVQCCGKRLPPAMSQSLCNYRFASYTILSKNPPQLEGSFNRTDGHSITGACNFNCVQRKGISSGYKQPSNRLKNNIKPLFADAATQTSKAQILHTQEKEDSNLTMEKSDGLDLREVSTNLQPQNKQLGRKHPNSPNLSRNLLLPDPQSDPELSNFLKSLEREKHFFRSLSPPPIVVMSPEPWTSQTPPDQTQLSITVPTLPRPNVSHQ
ncbi:uncharacterized protein LOC120932794 [Rana temporaria]|uniref:uncharacterized protein LOC120932794 n=1 Tax=Rana temporaria TaxID=8407 RepID=UPI001AAC4674|nr:uncharacterized protein LOC120932794 [Rana temporaria]